jgi:DivIVA domain-containing protein
MADMRAGPRPDEVAARTFPTSFRGFDPAEVRGYLAEVASALAAASQREEMLRDDLARMRATAANPAIDEATLLEVLGDESARVLQVAKEAASDIRRKADANAAIALDQAHSEAERIRIDARAAAEGLERDAEGILAIRTAEADDAAAALIEAAEAEAAKVREVGLAEARSMVAEARAVRERMLGDLKRRVQRGEATVEVLRVGRERLLEAFGVVRDRLDDATHSLATAEARARKDAEEEAERLGQAGAAAVDRVPLKEPAMPELQPSAAEVASPSPSQRTAAPAPAAAPVVVEHAEEVAPAAAEVPNEAEVAAAAPADPPVHTGEPSGEVAEVVPIGGVGGAEDEEDEHAPTPVFDSPAAAPSTGEVPTIAATGTDSGGAGIGRRRRRMLRLAEEPAVRAEEQRLSQLRYLHRPRTGGEPEVHLPEDGMVVVEPPSAGEAVRILRDPGTALESRALRTAAPSDPPRAEPAVTLLGPAPAAPAPAAPAPTAPAPAAPAAPRPTTTVQPGDGDRGARPSAGRSAEAPEAGPAPEPRKDAAALFARLRAERQAAAAAKPPPAPPSPPAPTVEDDEVLLQARDLAVEPVEHLLAKKVKRLLQDHQNAVLDRLRARRPPTALELLGEVEDLLGPLATAAEPLLGDAAGAGAAAAGAADTAIPVADLARDVAANVVKDLRPRLEAAYSVEAPEPRVERVNIAFREWRGERVGRLVGDAAHAAFARGHFVATPARTPLRWVADDGELPCPECEDNGLAGAMAKGTPFPTGHRHPPAHSGCRCLLARPPQGSPAPTSSRR